MKNLLSSNKLGEFSTKRKVAIDGYAYPNFDTKDANDAVQMIVDAYEVIIDYQKNTVVNTHKQNSMYIQPTDWTLYNFPSFLR